MHTILFQDVDCMLDAQSVLAMLPVMAATLNAGLAYLQRHVNASGRFDYKVGYPHGEAGDGYNLMRHAGATIELCRAHLMSVAPHDACRSIRALSQWLEEHVVAISRHESVCSDRHVDAEQKLGQTALGIVSLIAIRRGMMDSSADSHRRRITALANHLVCMHRPDGSVPSKYTLNPPAAMDFSSKYYPSQAVMALAAAYDSLGDATYLETALGAMRSITAWQMRELSWETFDHHWMIFALAALERLQPTGPWMTRLGGLVDWLVELPVARGDLSSLGSMRTTPIACRAEGFAILGLAAFKAGRHEQATVIARCCRHLLQACKTRQIPPGGRLGVSSALNGAFLGSPAPQDVRIDHVQHPVGAMLSYLQLLAYLLNDGHTLDEFDLHEPVAR